jgi:phosphoribosylaminoimidazole-succinocarboxamide synthase
MKLVMNRNHALSIPEAPVLFTSIPDMPLTRRGKDKDIYELGDMLLLVSTDRLSAVGKSLKQGVKGKGHIVNKLSAYWFRTLKSEFPNHFFSADPGSFPDAFRTNAEIFAGRSMLVWKTTPLPVRCVVRGYLAGPGWREYREKGSIYGTELPPGLVESQRLPKPIFSSTVKGCQVGMNDNFDFNSLQRLLGKHLAEQLRNTSLRLYLAASIIARDRGVLIADTKFEFGILNGKLIVIDECLTPDTSRFWAIERYRCGGPLPSMDKQLLIDYLETLQSPGNIPSLPEEMIRRIEEKYMEVYKLIVGERQCSQR